MKILASLLTCLFIVCKMEGQINEREITPVELSDYIPGFNEVTTVNGITVNVVFNTQPNDPSPVDGDSTTEGVRALKYADFASTNILMSYGNITSTSLGKVWTLRISVPYAKNVGLDFSQVSLTSNAEMYIYNVSGTRLKGVIKSEFFSTPQMFSVGPTKDSGIVIYILERNNFSSFQSSFVISKVFGGFLSLEYDDGGNAFLNKPVDQNGDFRINGVSGPFASIAENPSINILIDYNGHCSPYVQCFPDKITTARAVGRITSGGYVGTGTLLNNESNDGRAYFLTALHVLDNYPENRVLDAAEINYLATANFVFNYWRPCSGGSAQGGLDFSGATVRAWSANSDMVLLELNNPPGIGDGVNYAAWNRTTSAPSDNSSFLIHHPLGLDMRLTKTRFVRTYLFNTSYWQAGYDNHENAGTPWRGSSGCGLFNQNNQVVGQLYRGWSACNFNTLSDRYGKFTSSWDIPAFRATLSPTQNLEVVNQLTITPLIIAGSSEIGCNTNPYTYTVPNLTGVSYLWTIPSDFIIISGQSTSSITIRRNSSLQTSAEISVRLTDSKGRNRIVSVTKTISGGSGITGVIRQSGRPDKPMYTANSVYAGNANVELSLVGTPIISCVRTSGSGTWSYSNPNLAMNLSNGQYSTFLMSGTGSCGYTERTVTFYVSGGWGFRVAPNPVSEELTITGTKVNIQADDIVEQANLEFLIQIYDFNTGQMVKQAKSGKGNKELKLDIRGIKKGNYLLQITYDKYKDTRQIIIK